MSTYDKGEVICDVLLYLSKGFDCVDRGILIDKLESYVLRGKLSLLLKSYIGKRKQFVSDGGYESTCDNVY